MSSASSEHSIRRMRVTDLDDVRELARSVWGDQLYRDSGIEVEYPARDRRMYEAYLKVEPDGNLVAEIGGKVVAAAYAHSWGSIGWVGPLEVSPDHQGKGIGRSLMEETASYLVSSGCSTIGVETMGENDRNIGFYRSLGYSVHSPTFVYEKPIATSPVAPPSVEVRSSLTGDELEGLSALSSSIFQGMDLRKEFRIATEMSIGKVLLVRDEHDDGRIIGSAIVHERTVEGLSSHLLRALIVDPSIQGKASCFADLLTGSEAVASGMGARKLFFTSSASSASIAALADAGYKVIANNVRMLRNGIYSEKGELQLLSWAG